MNRSVRSSTAITCEAKWPRLKGQLTLDMFITTEEKCCICATCYKQLLAWLLHCLFFML